MQEREVFLFREVGYASLISANADPKKLPKNKIDYWALPSEIIDKQKRLKNMKSIMQREIDKYKNRSK